MPWLLLHFKDLTLDSQSPSASDECHLLTKAFGIFLVASLAQRQARADAGSGDRSPGCYLSCPSQGCPEMLQISQPSGSQPRQRVPRGCIAFHGQRSVAGGMHCASCFARSLSGEGAFQLNTARGICRFQTPTAFFPKAPHK